MFEDLARHTPMQQPRQPGLPPCADDDQIGRPVASLGEDLGRWITLAYGGVGVNQPSAEPVSGGAGQLAHGRERGLRHL